MVKWSSGMVKTNLGQSQICCEMSKNCPQWFEIMPETTPNQGEIVPNWLYFVQNSPKIVQIEQKINLRGKSGCNS